MIAQLTYIPFLTPMYGLQEWWYLTLLPLAFGISVIYKAMRMSNLHGFWRQVGIMTAQIVLGIIGLAVCMLLFVQVVIPLLPVK